MHIMGCPVIIFKKYSEDLFYLNSIDPDEMPHYGGLYCLKKFPLSDFPYTMG